jgi:hypothetical protein
VSTTSVPTQQPVTLAAHSWFSERAQQGFDEIFHVITTHGDALRRVPGVVAIRAGFAFRNGWITDVPALVIKVDPTNPSYSSLAVDKALAGITVPTNIVVASPIDRLRNRAPTEVGAEALVVQASVATNDLALPDWERYETPLAAGSPGALAMEIIRKIKYEIPTDHPLEEVNEPMDVICHASPDAGWPTLKAFLDATTTRLTIAMYNLSAPHVVTELLDVATPPTRTLTLILNPTESLGPAGTGDTAKAKDIPDSTIRDELEQALGKRLSFEWAAVKKHDRTTDGIFPTAYHIKVIVRDGAAIWLSSGNLQSSNQPDVAPPPGPATAETRGLFDSYNREWHVVIEHEKLAELFEWYIRRDYEEAEPFQEDATPAPLPPLDISVPAGATEAAEALTVRTFYAPFEIKAAPGRKVKVQPLLTPDNYARLVLPAIQKAEKTLYLQNQYIKMTKANAPEFAALVDAVNGKIAAGLDVRVILRDIIGARDMLEALKNYGFDMRVVKTQKNLHNKGIIIDGSVVILGSHNWSGDGTVYNRDASLILDDAEIAQYYQTLFEHDWHVLAHQYISAEGRRPAGAGEEAAAVNVVDGRWDEFIDD